MAQAAKKPIHFVIVEILDQVWAVPGLGIETAGGNSVKITNTLDRPVTVTHGGHLVADDPFTVPPPGSGSSPQKTHGISPGSDVSGTTFQLKIQASQVRAFLAPGDPTIIIL